MKERWVIPPKANGEFVWRMEDVLEVYTCLYDPRSPQVCLEETSTQLLAEARPPLPLQPGQPHFHPAMALVATSILVSHLG